MWDIGGQERIRTYWKSYYQADTKAIIYVIDSTDIERLEITRKALHQLLEVRSALPHPMPTPCPRPSKPAKT